MDGLLLGFAAILNPTTIGLCFVGALVGTLIGVLPGIGPAATISMLLPLTVGLDPVSAITMIAGVYYGASYGGSTTAILVNIPGEAQSVVTCLDGHAMARQGRAGSAIAIAAIGSFVAGTAGALAIGLVGAPLAAFAVRFGPPEYFALMLLGFTVLLVLARGSPLKSLLMIATGVLISTVGQDIVTGELRFDFGVMELADGISIVTLAMGLFGLSEVLLNLEHMGTDAVRMAPIGRLLPSGEEWRASAMPIARGSVVGFLIGLLPGGGAVLASFISYTMEKKLSRTPERFGHGAIEGVAGPETANNAGAAGAFIPLLTLGLPGNPVMAILLGALMLYGVAPGPLLMQNRPDVFWGVVASMYVGNAMLLLLNLPLVGLWVRLLRVPYARLFPFLILFMVIGAYATSLSAVELWLLLSFGVAGYLLRKLDFDLAPLVLAFVLGSQIEMSLRQTLMLGRGSPAVFLERPIAATLLGCALLLALAPLAGVVRRRLGALREANAAD